jgi:hypothetical protein
VIAADEYARQHESRRLTGVVIFSVFVLALGTVAALRIGGIGSIVVIVVAVAIVLLFVALWSRSPQPAVLTQLTTRRTGTWPATAPAMIFPGLLQARPSLRETTAMLGSVSFGPSGVTWEPSTQTARSFGLGPLKWSDGWIVQARRLRGASGLVQLNLTSSDGTQTVVLWMRRASDFSIP